MEDIGGEGDLRQQARPDDAGTLGVTMPPQLKGFALRRRALRRFGPAHAVGARPVVPVEQARAVPRRGRGRRGRGRFKRVPFVRTHVGVSALRPHGRAVGLVTLRRRRAPGGSVIVCGRGGGRPTPGVRAEAGRQGAAPTARQEGEDDPGIDELSRHGFYFRTCLPHTGTGCPRQGLPLPYMGIMRHDFNNISPANFAGASRLTSGDSALGSPSARGRTVTGRGPPRSGASRGAPA